MSEAPDLDTLLVRLRTAELPQERLACAIEAHEGLKAHVAQMAVAYEAALEDYRAKKQAAEIEIAEFGAAIAKMRADLILACYPPMLSPPKV